MNVIFSIIDEKNIKTSGVLVEIWVKIVTFASLKRKILSMNGLKTFLTAIGRSKFLKYALVIVAGVVLVGFVGENSILSHMQNKVRISELDAEIGKYRQLYQADRQKMDRLDRDPKAIEEIARERYFMKHADEDIFVFDDGDAEIDTTDNERVR